jgi:AraC-like DNA-binding protein
MLSCEARSFSEPSECAAAIRGVEVEMTIVGRGRFAADFVAIDLNALRLQRMSENLPLVYHSANSGGRADFLFQTRPGPSVFRDGIEVTSDSIVRRNGMPQLHSVRSSGPLHWGCMTLPLEKIPVADEAIPGYNLMPLKSDQVIKPPPGAMANLQRLHAAAALMATDATEMIQNPQVARGMEQILLQALVSCLESSNTNGPTSTEARHQKIMQRFHAIIKANATSPLYVLEMAKGAGASLRSLTACCQEHLGMGPKKYLLLRRMHLARQALSEAVADELSVTDVATLYGFWQFGRFAGEYKSLFGELPSITLHRSPVNHNHENVRI